MPEEPKGWPIATAPPLGLSFSSGTSKPSSWPGQLAQHAERLGGEGLVHLPHVDLPGREAGARERLGDRVRRRDAHDLRVERVRGRGHHARQRLDAQSLARGLAAASTTALAPSFSGEELPAVICVVPGCGGSAASFSALVSSRIDLVVLERARGLPARRRGSRPGGSPAARRPDVARRRGVLLRAQREGVDLLARQLVAVGDVLRRPDHLDVGVPRRAALGFGGPPAPAHIVSSMNTGPRGLNGASPFINAQPERDIDSTPAADADLQLLAADRVRDVDRAGQRRRAEAVDGRGRHRVRKARRERAPARDVAHPLVGHVHAARGDVLDLAQRDADALAGPARIVCPSRSSVRRCDSDPP